jgi:hypothetical protein
MPILDADWDDQTSLLIMLTQAGILLVYRIGIDATVGFVASKELGGPGVKVVISGK